MKEHIVRFIKGHLEHFKMTKRESFLTIRFYTPLYEKGIREKKNRPIETTVLLEKMHNHAFVSVIIRIFRAFKN